MSPNTLEAIRCALQSVCETGGTMDELALIEQSDRIAELEAESLENYAQIRADMKEIRILEAEVEAMRGDRDDWKAIAETNSALIDDWKSTAETNSALIDELKERFPTIHRFIVLSARTRCSS